MPGALNESIQLYFQPVEDDIGELVNLPIPKSGFFEPDGQIFRI